MMTGGLSGANRMHNTAQIQRFLSSTPDTCCSYCIMLLADLPTAEKRGRLKWISTEKQHSGPLLCSPHCEKTTSQGFSPSPGVAESQSEGKIVWSRQDCQDLQRDLSGNEEK